VQIFGTSDDNALKTSKKEAKLNKMKIQQEKNAEARGEMWIEAMNYMNSIHQVGAGNHMNRQSKSITNYTLNQNVSKRSKNKFLFAGKILIGRMRGTTGLKMDIPSHQESYLINGT
jgi:hypothetical protein